MVCFCCHSQAGRYSAELRLRDVPIAAGRRVLRLVCPEDTERALDGSCACVAGKQPIFDADVDLPNQRKRCEPCPEGEFKGRIGDFKCSPIVAESPIWPIVIIAIGSAAAVTLMTLFIAWMRMRQIRRKQHMQLELNFAAVTYHEIRNPLNGSGRQHSLNSCRTKQLSKVVCSPVGLMKKQTTNHSCFPTSGAQARQNNQCTIRSGTVHTPITNSVTLASTRHGSIGVPDRQ
eukprot:3774070-Pleurochrysis_carterae.AAC.3